MTANPKFAKALPNGFFRTLNTRVNQYFTKNHIAKTGNIKMYLKTANMLAMFLIPLVLMYFDVISGWWMLLGYLVMGFGMSGIGLCVMHDANHGAYSKYKWMNKLMSYMLNVIGGSSFTWKIQHNVLHHTYTNVYTIDEDIDDKPFLRLSPYGKLKKYHRFQHIYAMAIYSLATISWILYKDFKQLRHYNKDGLTTQNGFNPTLETLAMIGNKAVYVFMIIVLPILLGQAWYIVLLGFLIMHLFAGLYITTIFQLAHVVEGPKQTSTTVEPDSLENTWAIHQLLTTANFSTKSKLITWFSGGLNHQIEHHLFPNICHIHYPQIAKIVRETVKEFNLPYYEYDRFFEAVASHLRMLKSFGEPAYALVKH